uniref:Defensin beta 133 n=2 Tax=Ailuropoda melanoleuca TaxID=9646 RepID=A0A7N5JXZ5_AILME
IPVLLFFFFFFLLTDARVKYARKDIYSCFVKRCKCRHECHDFGGKKKKAVDFCTKLNTKCCAW